MTLQAYMEAAQRTSSEKFAARTSEGLNMKQLENGLMGLCGEAGECMEILKKHRHQGHKLDREKLLDELGDVLWYVAEAAAGAGYTLDEVARVLSINEVLMLPNGMAVDVYGFSARH